MDKFTLIEDFYTTQELLAEVLNSELYLQRFIMVDLEFMTSFDTTAPVTMMRHILRLNEEDGEESFLANLILVATLRAIIENYNEEELDEYGVAKRASEYIIERLEYNTYTIINLEQTMEVLATSLIYPIGIFSSIFVSSIEDKLNAHGYHTPLFTKEVFNSGQLDSFFTIVEHNLGYDIYDIPCLYKAGAVCSIFIKMYTRAASTGV